ncbi:MAG: ankyrin repeat domain-containing protein [Burkholderiales bacterium]|nr:ankyrin repeat domain-containing protein [Phycisphaerae bacterium]
MKARQPKGIADDANRAMWRLFNDKNWDAIGQCLARGEWDPNRPLVFELQPGGHLLLSAAVSNSQVALARQLIELGADVNARMRLESPPLMIACERGNAAMVDLLLQAGADVNAKCPISDEGDPGETALMAAATAGHRAIIETLLRSGARIDATTRRGRSALSMIVERRRVDLDMVRFLLDAGCSVDGRDLHYPVLDRNLELFQLLLDRKPPVDVPFDWPTDLRSPRKGDTPLFVAIDGFDDGASGEDLGLGKKRGERLAIIDLLIKAGADVNAQCGGKTSAWTPLLMAVAGDDEEMARRLIAAGADPAREIATSRYVIIGEACKLRKGPLSAIGMAEERPKNKKTRMLLLGHE